MAQNIVRYASTVANTGRNVYIYPRPEQVSTGEGARRVQRGVAVTLPTNYAERGTNGMWPVSAPYKGWILTYNLTEIKPVYETTTDRCTAPSSVVIDTITKTLTVNGGSGGDLNAFTGFGVSHRDRAIGSLTWGAWSGDDVISGRTMSVSVAGTNERQYRARTLGNAGSSWYSTYTECPTIIVGNTPAGRPTVELPVSGRRTISKTPTIKINSPADPQGNTLTLKRKIDGGGWASAASLPASGGVAYDKPTLTEGAHVVFYKTTDSGGADSPETSVQIVVDGHAWKRAISAGDVMANQTISLQYDLKELEQIVNVQRTFYGLPAIDIGAVGKFGAYQRQMNQMIAAIREIYTSHGASTVIADAVSTPTALPFQQCRASLEVS